MVQCWPNRSGINAITGTVIAATGATPDHVFAELLEKVHLSRVLEASWFTIVDAHMALPAAGVVVMAGSVIQTWRGRHASKAPAPLTGSVSSAGVQQTSAVASPNITESPEIAANPHFEFKPQMTISLSGRDVAWASEPGGAAGRGVIERVCLTRLREKDGSESPSAIQDLMTGLTERHGTRQHADPARDRLCHRSASHARPGAARVGV